MKTYHTKRGDTWPPLECTLTQAGGEPIPLDGASVRLLARLIGSPNTEINRDMTVVDAVRGVVSVTLTAQDTAIAGTYQAESEVVFATGFRVTVPNDQYFTLNILEDIR